MGRVRCPRLYFKRCLYKKFIDLITEETIKECEENPTNKSMYQSAMESHEDTPESDCQSMVSNDVLDREDHYGDDHDNFEGWKIFKFSSPVQKKSLRFEAKIKK